MSVQSRFDEVWTTIREWVESVLPYTVVMAGQNAVRPPAPYVSIKLLTGMLKLGSIDELRRDDDLDTFRLIGQRSFVVSIEAYGISARGNYATLVRATDMLGELQYSMDKPETIDRFRAIGMAVELENSIQDVTAILETEFEPRAVLDITFRIALDELVDPGEIETIEVRGELDSNQDGINDIIIDDTITKP